MKHIRRAASMVVAAVIGVGMWFALCYYMLSKTTAFYGATTEQDQINVVLPLGFALILFFGAFVLWAYKLLPKCDWRTEKAAWISAIPMILALVVLPEAFLLVLAGVAACVGLACFFAAFWQSC